MSRVVEQSLEQSLLVPLTSDQVKAASVIRDSKYMPGWATTDRALTLLAKSVPGWDADSVLVKAAAVNQLYNVNHHRLGEAADRISQIIRGGKPDDPVAVVEAIAPLPRDGKLWWFWAFASKFAHFFIYPDRVPIYDAWAFEAVAFHMGKVTWHAPTAYRTFAERVERLREHTGQCCSLREMDRYLWLSGMYRAWRANKGVRISREVRAVFESPAPEAKSALQQLLGQTQGRAGQ